MGKNHSKAAEIYESPYVKKIIEAREKLTGWERLKLVFTLNQYGETSPEVQRVITGTTLAIVIGGLMGGMGRGRIAFQNFMRSNAHEAFETPLEARRKLQDTVTLGMFSGAYRIAWRMALFTGVYLVASTGVSTYRGKMGIMDQVAGGGLAGLIYKFPQGPKPAVAGGTIGLGLGLFAGCLTFGLTKMTGMTIDQANLSYYHYLAKREEAQQAKMPATRKQIQRLTPDPQADPDQTMGLQSFHDRLVVDLKMERAFKVQVNNKSEETNNTASNSQEEEESDSEENQDSSNKIKASQSMNPVNKSDSESTKVIVEKR